MDKQKDTLVDEPVVPADPELQVPNDPLGREMARDAIRLATGEDDPAMERDDDIEADEVGGPFEVTTGAEEFAMDEDEAVEDGGRANRPTAMRS